MTGNRVSENLGAGIAYLGESSGVAEENDCIGNMYGILVWETAAPELIANYCSENSEADVLDRRGSTPGTSLYEEPSGPTLGNIVFALDKTDANGPVGAADVFPQGTLRVYAFFEIEDVSPGIEWTRTWFVDGEEVKTTTETWEGNEHGMYDLMLVRTDGEELRPAVYQLRLYIQGSLVQQGSFVVGDASD